LRKQRWSSRFRLFGLTPQTGVVKAEGKVITCGRRVGTAEGTFSRSRHDNVLDF
jgi:hypothetical protein